MTDGAYVPAYVLAFLAALPKEKEERFAMLASIATLFLVEAREAGFENEYVFEKLAAAAEESEAAYRDDHA